MPDIHVYVNRPSEQDVPALEGLEDVLKRLEHVSEARADPTGNVVAVSFEGGQVEQKEIEGGLPLLTELPRAKVFSETSCRMLCRSEERITCSARVQH